MAAPGLSKMALQASARSLCDLATQALARNQPVRAQLLLEQAAAMMERTTMAPSNPSSSDPLIVVDDDADTRSSIALILEELGHAVLLFSHGGEALDYLRGNPAAALILFDLTMPVMDGWAFHEAALADDRLAAIPMIVMTGSPRNPPPAVHVLAKPLRRQHLMDVVVEALGRNPSSPAANGDLV